MAEAVTAISSPTPDLSRLDAVLVKLPRPTPLRGMVQTVRAAVLSSKERHVEAVAAIEQGLSLLPADPRPKLVAFEIFTFTGAVQRAAELWLAASREAPDIVRQSDRYTLDALKGRLSEMRDTARVDQINARLGELGLGTSLAPERSDAALSQVRLAVRNDQIDLARQTVPAVIDPEDLLSLYVDRRYEVLWPSITEWASPTLAGQSARYLEQLRADWSRVDDFDTATSYANRLATLHADSAVVALFLPLFDRLQPGQYVDGVEFLGKIVARSLVQVGRADDARALLARIAATLPKIDTGIELNIVTSRLTLAIAAMDWSGALEQADAFMARAGALKSTINASAAISVRGYRACALTKLDRAAEAQQDIAMVLLVEAAMPGPVLDLQMCLGDVPAARAMVIRRLNDLETRGWALRFVQPSGPPRTPYGRMVEPMMAAVRAAPDVRTAAAKVGRVLPQPVLSDMPPDFDPFRSRPITQPLGADAT